MWRRLGPNCSQCLLTCGVWTLLELPTVEGHLLVPRGCGRSCGEGLGAWGSAPAAAPGCLALLLLFLLAPDKHFLFPIDHTQALLPASSVPGMPSSPSPTRETHTLQSSQACLCGQPCSLQPSPLPGACPPCQQGRKFPGAWFLPMLLSRQHASHLPPGPI